MTEHASIRLYESPLLVHLQPQCLELFSQHGRRAIKHARHRFPGALRLLRPVPGHLDDKIVVTTERQSGHDPAAPHRRRLRSGVGASPAQPSPLNETGRPQASCVQVGQPATRDITRQGGREKRYRAASWDGTFRGEPWSTALSTTVSITPARSRIFNSESCNIVSR